MTGYDLSKTFNQSLNFFWHAQMSQIYRDLGTLEKKEMVTSTVEEQYGKPDKKIYSITPKGEEEFSKWLDDTDFSDSLKYRDSVLLKLFFGGSGDKGKIKAGLEDYLALNEEAIKEYEGTHYYLANNKQIIKMMYKDDISEEELNRNIAYMRMTLSKGFITAKGNIEWARECINTLEDL